MGREHPTSAEGEIFLMGQERERDEDHYISGLYRVKIDLGWETLQSEFAALGPQGWHTPPDDL